MLRTGDDHPVRLGVHLRGAGRPDPVLRIDHGGTYRPVLSFLGAKAYGAGTDAYVLDMLALGDWFTGRIERTQPGAIDHEKPLPFPWSMARAEAAGAEIPADLMDRIPATPQMIEAAREALRCGEARELEEAVRDHPTAGRFLDNVGVAVRLHGFRFPPGRSDRRGDHYSARIGQRREVG